MTIKKSHNLFLPHKLYAIYSVHFNNRFHPYEHQEEAMNKTSTTLFAAIITLAFSNLLHAETKDIARINGVSEINRTVYNVHFSDGTTASVTGPLQHSGGDLSPEVKQQIDDFFTQKATEWKASLKMATDDGARNIDAITPTQVRLSVISLSFGDTNYIRVTPITVNHGHGSTTAHKQKVETLWNPVKSAKKAADKATKTVKKGTKKATDAVKKGTDKVISTGKKAVDKVTKVTKIGVKATKDLTPVIIKTIPEAISGGIKGGLSGGVKGATEGFLIPIKANVIPSVIKTGREITVDLAKDKLKDKLKNKPLLGNIRDNIKDRPNANDIKDKPLLGNIRDNIKNKPSFNGLRNN